MFKHKGLSLLVVLTAVAVFAGRSYAEAPTIDDPGDVIIGDLEGVGDNNFNFADAINLDDIVTDDSFSSASLIKWSYWSSDPTISINGSDQLPSPDLNLAVDPANTSPGQAYRIDLNDYDTGNPGQDGNSRTITFRNTALSPSNAGPFTDPGVAGIVTSQTRTVTLFASDCTTASSETIVVYTSNDTSDSLSGADPLELIDDIDLSQDQAGWTFALLTGSGSSGTVGGLCQTAPLTGDNYLGWIYTPAIDQNTPGTPYIDLVDEAVWRLRTAVTYTGGTRTPLWFMDYINQFSTPSFAIASITTYGGSHIVIDNQGGANGAGTANRPPGAGRDFYDLWLSPTAMLLPQWKGEVDPAFSAFSTQEDLINDMTLSWRMLDLDSAGLGQDLASGTLCLTGFQIARANVFDLWDPNSTPVFGPPMTSAFFSPASFDQVEDINETNSTSSISGGAAHYQLAPGNGEDGSRKTLLPYDPTAGSLINEQLYPIVWTTDKLYLYESTGYAEGASDADPYDIVDFIGFEPTIEYLVDHLTLRGFPNSGPTDNHMYRAGSFRLPANVASATQRYIGLYYTHNKTIVVATDAPDRITPRITISNFGDVIGSATDGQMGYALTSLTAFDLGNP